MSSRTNPEDRRRSVYAVLMMLGVLSAPCLLMRLRHPLDGWEGALTGLFFWTDTQFAPGYSEEAFARVRPGMSPAQVEALLGRPLVDRLTYEGKRGWDYSRSPGDTHYRLRVILFDTEERVERIHHEFYVD